MNGIRDGDLLIAALPFVAGAALYFGLRFIATGSFTRPRVTLYHRD